MIKQFKDEVVRKLRRILARAKLEAGFVSSEDTIRFDQLGYRMSSYIRKHLGRILRQQGFKSLDNSQRKGMLGEVVTIAAYSWSSERKKALVGKQGVVVGFIERTHPAGYNSYLVDIEGKITRFPSTAIQNDRKDGIVRVRGEVVSVVSSKYDYRNSKDEVTLVFSLKPTNVGINNDSVQRELERSQSFGETALDAYRRIRGAGRA